MRTLLALFITILVWRIQECLASNSTLRQLRGLSNVFEIAVSKESDVPSLYRITMVGTFTEQGDGAIVSEDQQTSCIPIIDGKETHELYKIDLPQAFFDENYAAISVGLLFVSITHTHSQEEEVLLTKDSKISVILDPRNENRDVTTSTMGTKSIAIVRISTKDASPRNDAATLREGLFSLDKINLKTQFSACSFGQLEWELAPAGVVEVLVDQPVSDFTSGMALVLAAQATMSTKMGIPSAADLGDKVIMCLPPGTGSWVASSGVNHWRAQFNNEWCLSLTATLHETGHMLGMTHSNEGGVAYGDSTGYMAAGHKEVDWPRKCFNGLENWNLGWYQKRQATLVDSFEAGHLVKLATFVDFNRTDYDEPVVVNVADLFYLQYNVAKGFNIDTEEKKNEITITAPGIGGSDALAGLKESGQYLVPNFQNTPRTLIIEACRKRTGSLGADVMLMSIAFDTSLCNGIYEKELTNAYAVAQVTRTRAPTPASPSSSPTGAPSEAPTHEPTMAPSSTPTAAPTEAPSNVPTTAPTKAPTTAPTASPAPSKGSVVVVAEYRSDSPTPNPISESTPASDVGKFGFWALFANIKATQAPAPKIDFDKLLKNRKDKMKQKHQKVQSLQDAYNQTTESSRVKSVLEKDP
jgi:hypothetical protein